MKIKNYDVVIAGASLGGCLAAVSLAKNNYNVVLVEQYNWIGGQLTSQAVPLDEHEFIEEFGCTKSYREYRNKVRDYYRNNPLFSDEARNNPLLNPGKAWVSRVSHEPKVALELLYEMLDPYIEKGLIEILNETDLVSAKVNDDTVEEILVKQRTTNSEFILRGKMFIDGTDTGDLLPLTNTEYVVGAEAKAEYNEPSAKEIANYKDMQSITWVAALEFDEGASHIIEKPKEYEFFKNYRVSYDDNYLLSWYGPDANTRKKRLHGMFGWPKASDGRVVPELFSYRRIIAKENYKNPQSVNDVTLLNWPQNDYFLGNIIDDENKEHHLYMARQQTLSLIYWLQTEAPRHDGKIGYPELKLRGDIVGTADGLAQAPYIRESRRIKALYTVKEQDVSAKTNNEPPTFWDSVGVGCYRIDMHLTTVTHNFFYEKVWPFEIPLGSLIPIRMKNLLPACKNIGTTHLTNSCYRLHPVEWNIGESCGYFASFCLNKNLTPQEVYQNKELVKEFQSVLANEGIELSWPKDKIHII